MGRSMHTIAAVITSIIETGRRGLVVVGRHMAMSRPRDLARDLIERAGLSRPVVFQTVGVCRVAVYCARAHAVPAGSALKRRGSRPSWDRTLGAGRARRSAS